MKHEGGKVQLSPIGVATHCLEIRDRFSRSSCVDRSRGGPSIWIGFFLIRKELR